MDRREFSMKPFSEDPPWRGPRRSAASRPARTSPGAERGPAPRPPDAGEGGGDPGRLTAEHHALARLVGGDPAGLLLTRLRVRHAGFHGAEDRADLRGGSGRAAPSPRYVTSSARRRGGARISRRGRRPQARGTGARARCHARPRATSRLWPWAVSINDKVEFRIDQRLGRSKPLSPTVVAAATRSRPEASLVLAG